MPSVPGVLALHRSSKQLILPGEGRSRTWYLILLPDGSLPSLHRRLWPGSLSNTHVKNSRNSLSLSAILQEVTLG